MIVKKLAGYFGIGKTLASKLLNDFIKTLRIRSFALVESECLFVKVSKKMKWLARNIGAFDRSFEQAPKVFHSVNVNQSVNILFSVIDYVVDVLRIKSLIRSESVRVTDRTRFNVSLDSPFHGLALEVCNDHRSGFATMPFKQSKNGDLAHATSAVNLPRFVRSVHVASESANIGFVHFDFAAKLASERSGLHGKSDTMLHKPCCFLGNTQVLRRLVTAFPVFIINNHPDSGKPLVQAQRRILKDGADFDGELPLLVGALALPLHLLGKERYVRPATGRTYNAFWPTARGKIVNAILRVGEVKKRLLECLGFGLVRHDVRILACLA